LPCREARIEAKGVASAAAVAQADLQGQLHNMELLISQEKSAHSCQISQLQQQVEALEADKSSAVKNYEDLSKSMQCASNKAEGATSQVMHLQNEIDAIKQVHTPTIWKV
jgi:chromosome segregation ATPase